MNNAPYINSSADISVYLVEQDIHERQFQPPSGLLLLALFALVLTVAHSLNIYLLLTTESAPSLHLIIHAVLVGMAGLLAYLQARLSRDIRPAMLLFITSAVMGPLGAAGSLLAALQCLLLMRQRTTFDDWYNSIFPHGESYRPEEIVEDIEIGQDENTQEYQVIPFQDVLEIGSEQQKRTALSRMTTHFEPRFAPAFNRALHDPSSAVRVQAATGIAKIENQFHDRLLKLARLYRERPDNPLIVLALAEHYDAYAFTGLLDSERERVNREKARLRYLEYLKLEPKDQAVRIKLGRLLLRDGREQEAADWLRQCMDEGFTDAALRGWYLESLYRTRQLANLRQLATEWGKDKTLTHSMSSELKEQLALWSNPPQDWNRETT